MCEAGLGRESYPGPVNVGALACVHGPPMRTHLKMERTMAFARPQIFRDA